ncbi:hypothetical protein COO60DRAFT_549399 [Scenedesmus sp. NREL 46B-D3]|nr:hypothetical protein COO60DRAFT_549399 [Scenedesmus sp. NREL 46B-D3]
MKLINAGGSLTYSAVVLAALWAVKSITAAARQRQGTAANSSTQQGGQASKYAFTISPTALARLVSRRMEQIQMSEWHEEQQQSHCQQLVSAFETPSLLPQCYRSNCTLSLTLLSTLGKQKT